MSSKTYHIKLNGKVYEVEIEEVNTSQNVSFTQKVETKAEVKKEDLKPVGNSSENITAPMPGTITNILVKEGDNVKKGQVLAILEAMKMENEIVAPHEGAVKAISVDKGQNVNPGETLLKMA